MENQLIKAFRVTRYETSPSLASDIWSSIVSHEKRVARIKLWAFSVIGLVSLVAIVPAFRALSVDLSQSGFFEYLSLGFSYGGTIFSFWRETSLSLIESLPTTSIIISFSFVFIFFWSIQYVVKQILRDRLSVSF